MKSQNFILNADKGNVKLTSEPPLSSVEIVQYKCSSDHNCNTKIVISVGSSSSGIKITCQNNKLLISFVFFLLESRIVPVHMLLLQKKTLVHVEENSCLFEIEKKKCCYFECLILL